MTGIVLTKLDGTAKGGIALAIARDLGIPVKLIGVGEQLEDLRPFDADEYARALLGVLTARPDSARPRDTLRHEMDPWVIWLIAAVVLAAGEIATTSFFLGPFAIGAFAAAAVSLVGGGEIAAPGSCSRSRRSRRSRSCGPSRGATCASRRACGPARRR